MFDIWRKIEEQGAAAVSVTASALSALAWVEVGEKYPESMPEEFRGYDVYSDPKLIWASPFVVAPFEDKKFCHFRAQNPVEGTSFNTWVDPFELVAAMGYEYFHTDEKMSAFGGILVCDCGIAGCAGIWSQTFHVSKKMVHWSILCDHDELDFFFERETYEKGVLTMLRAIWENPGEFMVPGPEEELNEDALKWFKSEVSAMLEREPYFQDMWNEKKEAIKNEE